jgi:hypothetical protein
MDHRSTLTFLLLLAVAGCGGSDGVQNPLGSQDLSDSEFAAVATMLQGASTGATTASTAALAPGAGSVALKYSNTRPMPGQQACPVSGHITQSGNVTVSGDTDAGTWSVYGLVTFQIGDRTNNLNDCEVAQGVIVDGTLTLTVAGDDAQGVGCTVTGSFSINRRGSAGGLEPHGSCFVFLNVPKGGARATGTICGRTVT